MGGASAEHLQGSRYRLSTSHAVSRQNGHGLPVWPCVQQRLEGPPLASQVPGTAVLHAMACGVMGVSGSEGGAAASPWVPG
jgi:hypothetical protein